MVEIVDNPEGVALTNKGETTELIESEKVGITELQTDMVGSLILLTAKVDHVEEFVTGGYFESETILFLY